MRIADVQRRHEQRLLALPNVKGVGIGVKEGRKVILVMVTHKVPLSALKPEDVIPETLEGFEVDVKEIGEPMAQSL